MKTSNRGRVLGGLLTGGLILTITTTIPTSAFSITAEQPDVIAPLGTVAAPAVAPTESPPAATYSAGVAEILKMVDAKVDPQVIKAYIKNSPIPYSPTSSEIIALKEHGVSDDILTTMMQRGAEVRAQGAAAANQAPPAPMAPGGYAYAPAPTYGSDYGSVPYVDYSYGYPYYGYPYYGYPYSYGWYGYPYYYYPFYCGYYGCGNHYYHCHNGHCYGHFGNFHGSVHNGFVHTGQAWHSAGSFGAHSVATGSRSFAPMSVSAVRSSAFAAHSSSFAGRSSGSVAMHASGGFHGGGGGGGGHSGGHR